MCFACDIFTLFSRKPGGKSGLLFKGVNGPGEGVILSELHVFLKLRSVGHVRGCEECSLGVALAVIHGVCERGIRENESSVAIQSYVPVCMCQSISLVIWQAA